MGQVGVTESAARGEAPSTLGGRLRMAGPGLVIAATGVGAGDMVTSLSAGTQFGTTLLWAILIGVILKYALTEGIGRWYMATGDTIMQGWHSLGRWATSYFVIYLFIITFVFGAAVTSAAALAASAMFPDVMPLPAWAVLHGVFGFVVVGIGRYGVFERVMEVFVGLLFVTVVGLAFLLAPNLGELAAGLVPSLPEGSLLYALAVIGGVGGTFTLASYTYWTRERGWRRPSWIPTMRTDLGFGYVVTGLFMVAMIVVGAELLFASGRGIGEEAGLVNLSDPIARRFGTVASWLFLVGFWSAVTSSILGAWNGGAHLFADFVRTVRGVHDERAEGYLSESNPFFRAFLVWITFPPMALLALDEPVLLVIVYAALGALFMPFLAITLLWLLNSRRVDARYRNRTLSNTLLGVSVLLFVVVGVQEVVGAL